MEKCSQNLNYAFSIIFVTFLVILFPILQASAYCLKPRKNPTFTGSPVVQQVDVRTVRVSWFGIIDQRECADQFLVKYWASSSPQNYILTSLVNNDVNTIDIEVTPFVLYEFQAVARVDKGLIGGIDWYKSKVTEFKTSKQNNEVSKPNDDAMIFPEQETTNNGIETSTSTAPTQIDRTNVELKKFIINEFDIILEWSNGEISTSPINVRDQEACIYDSFIEQDPRSSILFTGCPNKIRRFEIQSRIFGDMLGKINLDDSVEEIILEPVKEPDFLSVTTTRTKRSFLENPEFDEQFPDLGIAFSGEVPKVMTLPVNVYLSPSFSKAVRSIYETPEIVAKQELSYAMQAFLHDSLDSKVHLDVSYINTNMDNAWIEDFKDELPSKYLEIGKVHVLLVNKTIHGDSTTEGVGVMDSVCDKNNRKAVALVNVVHVDPLISGKIIAHEIGHTLGIGHDFQSDRKGRKRTCGPGKWKPNGFLMNYGKPRKIGWSSCSNEDFNTYFTRVIQSKTFCLKDESTIGLKNFGEDCWHRCNKTQGKCDWCGERGWCCRKEWIGNGCDGIVGGNFHTCVLNESANITIEDQDPIYEYTTTIYDYYYDEILVGPL